MIKNALVLLLFHLFCFTSLAQSVEIGFVKEYNGEKAQTPLAGVELSVNGAPSTISDCDGGYVLKFSVLKPGQAVKYNEIYKSGYVIFNKESLNYWRISNSQKPFIIVMCKENAFRELKKKFYGIIEKSYKDEYLKQKAIAENTIKDAIRLESEKNLIRQEYDKKLSNINTYVELFARIDRSEMDTTVARALTLIENGKINEGIKAYEELKLIHQVEYQLNKWASGDNMRKAADLMISDSQQDLVILSKKLKQQMALYEMGGEEYKEKFNEANSNLIKVYYKLNSVFSGKYSEELGMWICYLADKTKPWVKCIDNYREAANLPSWHGLLKLGLHYEILAYNDIQYVDSAKMCFQKANLLEMPDSIHTAIQNQLLHIADFFVIQSGDTICYKKLGKTDSVYISSKTNRCYNKVSGVLEIPKTIIHHGKTYHVIGVSDKAFFKNRQLRKVILPDCIHTIGHNAFDKCDSLKQIVIGKHIRSVFSDAIPMTTEIILPIHLTDTDWITEFINERFNTIAENANEEYYQPFRKLLLDLSRRNTLDKQDRIYFISSIGYLDIQYGDTISGLQYLLEASRYVKNVFEYDIGSIYYSWKDFANAYKYFVKCARTDNSSSYNALAYMYARGEYVKQNYQEAMKLIDRAISLSPDNESYIDSKGEIYLMMGQRDKALIYWNKVLEMNPLFDTSKSELYGKLFNNGEEKESAKHFSKQIFIDYKTLRNYINVIQLISQIEYEKQFQSFNEIEYEEMVSIGVIVLQGLIKNKTQEQLANYNDLYIATVAKTAIHNEIISRFPWYKDLYYDYQDLWQDSIYHEYKQGIFSLMILQIQYQLYNKIMEKKILLDNNDILKQGKIIDQSMTVMPDLNRKAFRKMIIEQKLPSIVAQEMGIPIDTLFKKIELCCDYIKNACHNQNLGSYANFHKDNAINLEDKTLRKYIGLAQIVAILEELHNSKDSLRLGYDELCSIGIIAVEVLLKTKTPEQLIKYDDIYIATAIKWAVENELIIRYKQSRNNMLGFFMNDNDTIKGVDISNLVVRIAMYRTVGIIYKNQELLKKNILKSMSDELPISNIVLFANQIRLSIEKIPLIQDRQLLEDVIFGNETVYALSDKYEISVENIITRTIRLLDVIKSDFKNKD